MYPSRLLSTPPITHLSKKYGLRYDSARSSGLLLSSKYCRPSQLLLLHTGIGVQGGGCIAASHTHAPPHLYCSITCILIAQPPSPVLQHQLVAHELKVAGTKCNLRDGGTPGGDEVMGYD